MSTPDKDDLEVRAWLIQYEQHGVTRSVVHGHNCVADYRQFDPNAVWFELVSKTAALAQIAELRERLEKAEAKYGCAIDCSRVPHTLVTTEPDLPAHQPNWSQAISDEAFNAAIAAAKAKGLRLDDQGGDRN